MRDLELVLSYVPRPQRFYLADLFALDAALGQVVRTTREPMVGRIRLAWWRERLDDIDQGLVPAEPQLEATAQMVAATPLSGGELSALADLWAHLLEPFPWSADTIAAVAERGSTLFGFGAQILGAEAVPKAGSLWSLMDVARHCSDEASRSLLIEAAQSISFEFVAEKARPLTMLGLLARRDLDRWSKVEAEATPARAWALIRHRLTGKL